MRMEALLLTVALLSACGGNAAEDRGGVEDAFLVRQIDGGIAAKPQGSFTADEPQRVVITERSGPGHDQGCVIVFTEAGERLVTHPCTLPPRGVLAPLLWEGPGSYLNHQCATAGTLESFRELRGRRFLAFTTHGGRSPSSLTVLEAVGRTRLERRVEFWNQGHLHHLAQDGTIVAALGMNAREVGEHSRYGAILLVIDLADLPEKTPAVIAVPPGPAMKDLPAPAKYVLTIPIDHPEGAYERDIEIVEGKVRALMISGLTYVLDLDEGTFNIEMTDSYVEEYAFRKNSGEELPATPEERLGSLRKSVVLHSRRR